MADCIACTMQAHTLSYGLNQTSSSNGCIPKKQTKKTVSCVIRSENSPIIIPLGIIPEKIRRVKFYDSESKRILVFLTNNMDVTASEIALLDKHR